MKQNNQYFLEKLVEQKESVPSRIDDGTSN